MSFFRVVLIAILFAHAPQAATSPGVRHNRPPAVKLKPAADSITLSGQCSENEHPVPMCAATSPELRLKAEASDPDGDRLLYTYQTTGGTLSGDGPETTLDLTGVAPGIYTVTVEVNDGRGGGASDAARVTVMRCSCPLPVPTPPQCPTVTVSCPDSPGSGRQITYTASVSGGDPNVTPTFKWEVSAGTISRGQGTHSITVDASKTFNSSFTGAVEVGGYDRSCETAASCSLIVEPPVRARKYDEYGVIPVGDEKLRLDNFVVELQNDPSARGYLICYGGRRGRAGEALRRCERARNYVVSTRGIEAARVVTADGGSREQLTVELWFVPHGAVAPQPTSATRGRGRR